MSTHQNHPFHLVNISPWPITGAIGAMTMAAGLIKMFHQHKFVIILTGIMITLLTMIQWWRDITGEGNY